MTKPYLNREIDEKFADIKEALARIEIQTTQTNGTVKWTVKMIWLAIGGISVLTAVVIPVGVALIQKGTL